MITCFLSHSSKDKANYVQLVAERLPKQWRVYDSDTFESGMKTLDEILRTLSGTSLFVLFLSESSLGSDWVRKEIVEAKRLEMQGKIKQIFPLIIDKTISYNDPRIPDWMREEYNLRSVTRPTVAVKRITQRLRELSWEKNPRLKERQKIFVGRNDQIREFEERFDDYTLPPPACVICSGLPVVGRKTLLKHALAKAAAIRDSYIHPEILLTAQESIEDFIIKLYDLGFSDGDIAVNLMQMPLDKKIELAASLCKDISDQDDILLIEDNGCLVTYERTIADWFSKLIEILGRNNKTTLAVAARFRVHFGRDRRTDIFYVPVPELNKSERMGLFKRISEFERLALTASDYKYFEDLLFGFPDQVFYAVALIKELGLPTVKLKTELLVEFNSDRAAKLVELNAPNDNDRELLYLLSEFDFISYEFLDSLVDPYVYNSTLERFLASAMCEVLGSNREYIRINDSIRDYMRRSRMPLPKKYEDKLREHVDSFLKAQDKDDIDASDYLFSMRRALTEGKQIDPKLLIPSHFLKAMKDLYDRHRNYSEVITLADRVLESQAYIDPYLTKEIRYFLCQSLARLKQKRFLSEVQHVKGPEHNFLLGFYYRMCGRTADAIERQLDAIKETRTASRARRELVQLYVNVEDFETARILAEQNYNDRPSNPFHIQAYLKCLINLPNWKQHEQIIKKLLVGLENSKTQFERAEEMYLNALAQYQAYCLADYPRALQTIEDAIDKFPNNPYPLFTKINILFRQRCSADKIEELLKEIEHTIQSESLFRDAVIKMKAQLQYLKGNEAEAHKISKEFIDNIPEDMRNAVTKKLRDLTVSVNLEVIQ